jgi:hypothetical protein
MTSRSLFNKVVPESPNKTSTPIHSFNDEDDIQKILGDDNKKNSNNPLSSSSSSPSSSSSSKRHESPIEKKKLGWKRIQTKTDSMIDQIKLDKKNGKRKKKKSTILGTSLLALGNVSGSNPKDRSHAITDMIDSIRAEQIQRLGSRKQEKRKQEEEQHKPRKFISVQCLKTYNIHPKSSWKQIWDIAILLLVVFSSIQIPLTLAFPDMIPLEQVAQITIDVIFIVDFGFCFRTGYIRPDNEVEMDQSKILKNYLKTWFGIDLAACFPLDYFFPEDSSSSTSDTSKYKQILRLLKLPRLLRLGRLLKFLARFKYAGVMKILKFILLLVLVAHWVGCAFFFIIGLENEYGYNTWMEHNVGLVQEGEGISSRYLTMLYTSFLMLIGEGMDMETDVEKAYGAFVVLIGTIVTAVIVGNVSFVVSNQNSTAFQYQSKIDMITDEMRALHLPSELQERTLQYYDYLWNRHRIFDPATSRFTADLSPSLRKEILLHMNRECVLNCDFFRDVSNECIIRLVHSFKFAVYLGKLVICFFF